jgi:hypothetical protein
VIYDIGHDDLRRTSCCAKPYTGGSTMNTSMEMEATSFSEPAPAARRDCFAGSNSGVGDEGDR